MNIVSTKHEFNSAMIGMILFDGSMPNDHCLYLRHGGRQLSLVDEKVEYISKYLAPKSLRSGVDKKGYEYRYAYFNNDKLKFLYDDIYIDCKKHLSQKLLNRFDKETLAFMYIDDGCLCLHKDKNNPFIYKSREILISTNSFSFEEVDRLTYCIRKKYDVDFHITKDKGRPRIWCNTKNTIKFLEIVAPVVKNFPSCRYKLDLKYKSKNISFL